MKAMNNEQTGHYLSDAFFAGTSLLLMLFGWISIGNIHTILQVIATLVSIGAGSMVFYNNYKQSRKNKPKQ